MTTTMDDPRKVQLALDALGDTCSEVAETLEGIGITGRPGMPECCAIANYLKACGSREPLVDHCGNGMLVSGDDMELPLPRHICEFTEAFDEYKFPELLDEECLNDDDDDG